MLIAIPSVESAAITHGISVVIHDFYFMGTVRSPLETDAELIVDSEAVLSLTIPVKRFQAIGGRRLEVGENLRCVDHQQLSASYRCNVVPSPV
jgi:hypothetical protein